MMQKFLIVILLALTFYKVRAQNFYAPSYYGLLTDCGVRTFYTDTIANKFYLSGLISHSLCNMTYNYIACRENNSWTFLGKFNHQLTSVVVYNGELYASGYFDKINSDSITNLAKFNGTNWVPVPNFSQGYIHRLKVINNELYACGGELFTVDGTFNGVAKFNGNNWSGFGIPYLGDPGFTVKDIAIYQGKLMVGGNFYLNAATQDLIYYNNGQWQVPGLGLSGGFTGVNVMQEYKGILYIGGLIYKGGYNPSNMLVAWDGTNIIPVGDGLKDGLHSYGTAIVRDMMVFKDKLFIAGGFVYAADIPSMGLTMFDGYTFCSFDKAPELTSGLDALGSYNDSLWVAGYLKTVNDSVYSIGKYIGDLTPDTCSYQLNVGIKESTGANRSKAFPNPFTNKITLNFDGDVPKGNVKITNAFGQQVYFSESIQSKEIDLEFLPKGIYFLHISSPSINQSFKIIKD